MATFQNYVTGDGRRKVTAVVAVKGFARLSKSFESKAQAKAWATEREAELRALRERGGAVQDLTRVTIRDLVAAYRSDPAVIAKKRSLGHNAHQYAVWVDEYGSMRAREFGYLQIIGMRDKLLVGSRQPGTVNRYLSTMRRVWNWAKQNYSLHPWPDAGIMLEEPTPESLNEKYGTTQATIGDIDAILAECEKVSPHLRDLTGFLIGTGARLGDALAVQWRDVDLETGTVRLAGEKTRRPLNVAMLKFATDAIKRAAKMKNVNQRVFWQWQHKGSTGAGTGRQRAWDGPRSPQSSWVRARANFPAHLRLMRLHDCRHLCASYLARSGASVVELANQLGHKTLTMVQRYASLAAGHRSIAHDRVDALVLKNRER
jgi:integrase